MCRLLVAHRGKTFRCKLLLNAAEYNFREPITRELQEIESGRCLAPP